MEEVNHVVERVYNCQQFTNWKIIGTNMNGSLSNLV